MHPPTQWVPGMQPCLCLTCTQVTCIPQHRAPAVKLCASFSAHSTASSVWHLVRVDDEVGDAEDEHARRERARHGQRPEALLLVQRRRRRRHRLGVLRAKLAATMH